MHTALRAGALLLIAGAVAGLVLIFATDPAEAPTIEQEKIMTLSLTSSEFVHEGTIPYRFTCDGENVSPKLSIDGVPAGAKSLALVMDDPDVPKQLKQDGVFDHWVLFNITPNVHSIGEKESVGTVGANGRGELKYTGPCPPRFSKSEATMKIQVRSQSEPPPPQYEPSEHRYIFKLYALDIMLELREGATKQEVLLATQGHILSETTLIGRYRRSL